MFAEPDDFLLIGEIGGLVADDLVILMTFASEGDDISRGGSMNRTRMGESSGELRGTGNRVRGHLPLRMSWQPG